MITLSDKLVPDFFYVITAPFFWSSMGATFSVGMVIGAILYNGDLSKVHKGVISILVYASFIFFTTYSRIADTILTLSSKPLASLVTLLIVSVFYVLGMYFGVLLVSQIRKRRERKYV